MLIDFGDVQVTELNPSSHVGYQLTCTALRGTQRYDEAIKAFTIMLSKMDDAPEAQLQGRPWNISPSSGNAYLVLQICVSSMYIHPK